MTDSIGNLLCKLGMIGVDFNHETVKFYIGIVEDEQHRRDNVGPFRLLIGDVYGGSLTARIVVHGGIEELNPKDAQGWPHEAMKARHMVVFVQVGFLS